MVLDALNPPNAYTEVAIELTSVANTRSVAYPRIYLTEGFRIGDEGNSDNRTYRIELTCHEGRISYWEDQ